MIVLLLYKLFNHPLQNLNSFALHFAICSKKMICCIFPVFYIYHAFLPFHYVASCDTILPYSFTVYSWCKSYRDTQSPNMFNNGREILSLETQSKCNFEDVKFLSLWLACTSFVPPFDAVQAISKKYLISDVSIGSPVCALVLSYNI